MLYSRFSFLQPDKPFHLTSGFVDRRLQLLHHKFQILTDGKSLRAMLFTLAAFFAKRSIASVFLHRGTHKIFPQAVESVFRVTHVIAAKTRRNVHTVGTGHTVTAAGAANLYLTANFALYLLDQGEVLRWHNIDVVYTKEAETADLYIEKTAHVLAKKYRVTVATSDAIEQVIIFGAGAFRMSAQMLLEEIIFTEREMREQYGIGTDE